MNPLNVQTQTETLLAGLQTVADILLALACYLLVYLLLMVFFRRRDLPAKGVLAFLALFFFAGGTVFVFDVWAVWFGAFLLHETVKLIAAGMALITAILLWTEAKDVINMRRTLTIEAAKQNLAAEVQKREAIEASKQKISEAYTERMTKNAAELSRRNQELEAEITIRKKTEEELRSAVEKAEAANRAKTVFLENMSHEIRTPLTSILGFASALTRSSTGKHLEFARRIEQGGHRLMDMLNAVMTLTHLDADRASFSWEVVNVSQEVKQAVQAFQETARKKGLTLTFVAELEAERVTARVDRKALSRVLYNLISNGLKFTREGGVTVIVGVEDERVRIRIQDSGQGIDPAFMPHLFTPFEQASKGLARSHEGIGLGLVVAQRLVDQMQGTLDVESKVGVGSVFLVSLPVWAEEKEAVSRSYRQG